MHPVHAESVAWISGRTDLVACSFVLLAVLLYRRARRGGGGWYAGALVAGGLAMASKETALVLPLVLLALEGMEPVEGRGWREGAQALLPFVLLAGAFAARILWLRLHAGGIESPMPPGATPLERLLTAGSVLLVYAGRLLLPIRLDAELEPAVVHGPAAAALAGLGGGIALLVLSLLCLRRRRALGFGGILFLAALLPALNLLIPINELAAERYLYIPSAGAAAVAASLVSGFLIRDRRFVLLAGIVLAVFTARTLERNRVWHDPLSLFSDSVARSPGSARAHFKLAYTLEGQGRDLARVRNFLRAEDRLSRAESEYRAALACEPEALDALRGLGTVLEDRGRFVEGARVLESAYRRYPRAKGLAFDLGKACLRAGRFADAFALVASAAAGVDPGDLVSVARGFAAEERWREARALYRKALQGGASGWEALRGLGSACVRVDPPDFATAARCFRAALSLRPGDAASMADLAMVIRQSRNPSLGRPGEAVALARQALSLDPRPRHYLVLAHLEVDEGRPREALRILEEGLARKPSDPRPFRERIARLRKLLEEGGEGGGHDAGR